MSLDGIEFDTESVTGFPYIVPGSTAIRAATMEGWHSVGAAGEPAFGAGCAQAASEQAVGYRKDPFGRVLLRGVVTCPATANTTLFTLPPGYRPPSAYNRFAITDNAGNISYGYVSSAGAVVKASGTATAIDLSGVEFDTDSVNSLNVQAASVPEVTVLPGVGADGQEVDLLVDAAGTYGGPYLWRCKYRAATPAPYRWHVMTASPLVSEYHPGEATTFSPNAWGSVSANEPSIYLPFAGIWDAFANAVLQPAITSTTFMGVQVAGVEPNSDTSQVNANCVYAYWPPGMQTGGQTMTWKRRLPAQAANARLLMRERHNGASSASINRAAAVLTALPVRIG